MILFLIITVATSMDINVHTDRFIETTTRLQQIYFMEKYLEKESINETYGFPSFLRDYTTFTFMSDAMIFQLCSKFDFERF